MEKQFNIEMSGDGDEPPEPSLTVQVDEGIDGVDDHWLQMHALRAITFLGTEQCEIAIRIVNDASMSLLHEKHSGVKGTTDVLTFNQSVDTKMIIADIAICCDVAKRAASDRAHSMNEELMLYIVHGILHCSGFDDHDEQSHRLMPLEEDRILSAIGVGNVWSSEE